MISENKLEKLVRIGIALLILGCVFLSSVSVALMYYLGKIDSQIYLWVAKAVHNESRVHFYKNFFVFTAILFGILSLGVYFLKKRLERWFCLLFSYGLCPSKNRKTVAKKHLYGWLLIFILIGMVSVYLSIYQKEYFVHTYILEDGPVEYMSFLSWIAAMILFIISYRRQPKNKSLKIIYFFFILLCFVCGMEEISWGQRIFGFKGPSAITQYNLQREFNFHDIGSISVQENGFFALTIITFALIPFLRAKYEFWNNFFENIGWPLAGKEIIMLFLIATTTWVAIGIIMGTLGFWPLSWKGYYNQCDDEIFELFSAMLFFALAHLDLAGDKRHLKDARSN